MHRYLTTLASTLALSVVLCPGVLGEQASESEMENVAHNWVTEMVCRTGDWGGDANPILTGEHEIRQDGVLLARYYDVAPQGFVVVPVLKEMTPVMLYSDESNLDQNQEEGMLQLIKDVLVSRLDLYRQTYGNLDAVQPATGEVLFDRGQKAGWSRLAVLSKEFRLPQSLAAPEDGGPLLSSSWHQGSPYNNSCPKINGVACAVGCAATSMSQILDYWEWPAKGVGNRVYHDDDCGFQIADYSDPYDWANIVDSCDGTEGCTAEQQAALAELCYEAGVSVGMKYGLAGSEAGMYMMGLARYFRYSSSIARELRSDHTQQSWFDLIRSEIDSGRVMWYGIKAHAIVCDGYRDNAGELEYHMNYGWGGWHNTNAWYVLDNLYCYWVPSDSVCPYLEEELVVNIKPQYDPVPAVDVCVVDDDQGDDDGLAEPGETVRLTPGIVNNGNNAVGTVGMLSTSDPYVTINGGSTAFGPAIDCGETGLAQAPIEISIASGCPDPYVVPCSLSLTCDGGYQSVDPLYLFVGTTPGFEDDMESGPAYWTSRAITVGHRDEWHLETSRSHSGATSWKARQTGPVQRMGLNDGGLITPPFLLPANARLTFWHWIQARVLLENKAAQGGIVLVRESGGEWTQITPTDQYPFYIPVANYVSMSGYGSLSEMTPCYSGNQDWTEAAFDLSAYSGVVQLMFRFGGNELCTQEGWYIDDVWIGNTVTGAAVAVAPYSGVTVTFDEVTEHGITTATVSPTGPEPPGGYDAIPASPREYYTLTTTATYSGDARVCLTYDDDDVLSDEADLRVLARNGDVWTDVTVSLDTDSNRICGAVAFPATLLIAEKTSCCVGRVGDANFDGSDEPTIGDVSALIDAKFITGTCDGVIDCLAEADINLSGQPNPDCDAVTIGDITVLIDYLFITGPEMGLPDCP